MKRMLLLFAMIAASVAMIAQDEEEEDINLVPNGDFESANTKPLKSYGMLNDLCDNWYSATKAPADLFAAGIRSEKVSIPENSFGKQEAASGDLYAGFRAYTKDKKKTRSYIAVELKDDLEKNQMYCVEFKVSLADLSKYGANYIGAAFVDRKTIQPNTGSMVRDLNDIHIKHRANKPITVQDGWETICGVFVGTGQEEYMMIGCFGSDQDLELPKMKRPRDVTGVQTYDAYYYIDDVKVYPIEAKSQCSCDPAADRAPDLIYGSSTVIDENMSDSEIVSVSAVYYAAMKKSLTSAGMKTLDEMVRILNDNPDWKLEVIGHCDNDEFDEAKINVRYRDLGKQRAEQAVRYLVSKGISESRLITLTKENTDPANTRPTDLSRAQNRRVVFVIRK
ncbi:MAG: OmpA family protein [Flavobacteriales bacterium]|nr:OmpA family protein [Flavobacteriales bacterium]